MQSNPVLSAIKDGFIDIMPVTIMGSFCTLFQFIISTHAEGYISLANVPGMAWLEVLTPIWSTANYGCMNFMAVMVCFMVSMHFCENIGHPGDKTAPAVALACFVTLMDTTATGTMKSAALAEISNGALALNGTGEEDVAIAIGSAVASTYTKADGLFTALIVGILATLLYVKLVTSGKLTIKLPDSVPPNVSQSFAVLFPTVITVFVFAVVGFIFSQLFGLNFFALISAIMAPVQAIMTGLPGYLLVVLIMMLLWWFGIHGPNVMSAITTPFMNTAWAANQAIFEQIGDTAYKGGSTGYQIISAPFGNVFFSHTGSGITGGLIISILLFSKRDDFKAIAKLAIPCGIFNINEPIIFGIPMVMNPLLGIPFFLAPVASVVVGYILTRIGLCPIMVINAPWTTPTGILGFLASGAKLMGGLTQLLAFATSILIYAPFVIMANAQTAEA
jgi:PTS system cellobiose-specific IIC component